MTPQQIWISYSTMIRKEFVRIMRIWSQTLLPPVITSLLYFIVFGAFIGSQLPPIGDFSYMQFIVPGLIMMSVITSAYTNSVSTFYFAKFVRNIEEILVSPTPDWVVIVGFVSGGVMRGLIVGVLVLAVSLLFTHLTVYSTAVLLVVIILTAILFSLAGLINGVFAKSFDGISIVPTFVLAPLTYLGGVFYSVERFPEVWQNISLANPVLYMVNAFRYGFLGISDIPLWICFSVLLGMMLAFLILVLWLFREGIGVKH